MRAPLQRCLPPRAALATLGANRGSRRHWRTRNTTGIRQRQRLEVRAAESVGGACLWRHDPHFQRTRCRRSQFGPVPSVGADSQCGVLPGGRHPGVSDAAGSG